jgi:hypothetical protein
VLDISRITEDWLDQLDLLTLPRVYVAEAGPTNAHISDLLRWARSTFTSRWPAPAG